MAEAVKVKAFVLLLFVFFISVFYGCGGAAGESDSGSGSTTTSSASYVDLIASSPQINSDGTSTITLTALVKDSKNRALSGETVEFKATSGTLTVSSNTTDASGQAAATLDTIGNKANRTITVTATAGSITSTMNIAVIGTTIDISGQDGLALGASAIYTITLKDSSGTGIPNQTVTLSSLYNTLSATTITTNSSGQGTVTLTATDSTGRQDTLSASGFGSSGSKSIAVNTVAFTFTAPSSSTTIPINTSTSATVNYTSAATPQAGVTVYFTASRGTLSSSSATTNSAGNATVQIESTTTGESTITATIAGGASTQITVEFVATNPVTIDLQADPKVIGINSGNATTQNSMITAVLRDSANNPVKNKKINFSLIADGSVGKLSPDTATSNSAGAASVYYIAGPSYSGTEGVTIKASVEGMTLSTTVKLTVARTSLFIAIGTGDKIYKPTTETYRKDFAVIVTDSGGNPVSGATVTARLTPVAYLKGYYSGTVSNPVWNPTLESSHPNPPLSPYAEPLLPTNYCGNEDITYWPDTKYTSNGILDAGEDYNGNGLLDPGGIAGVTPSVTTDDNGVGTIGVTYPKQFATWVYIRLEVTVSVSGTEGMAHTLFMLLYAADDYTTMLPPDSPFGYSTTCSDAQ